MRNADVGSLIRAVGIAKEPPRPILFDVHLDASPPSYEILFLAELDSDHRVAQVPFKETPDSELTAFSQAFSEFQRLTKEDIYRCRGGSRLIERTRV